MNQFKKNIEFLKKSNTDLYNIIAKEQPLITINITELENRNLIIETDEKKCFLHSVYDIEDELKRMFEGVEKDSKTLLIFGLGMGHIFDYIKNNFNNINHLIIIEPSLSIFNNALKEFDLQAQFKAFPRITFIVNRSEESAINILKLFLKETTQFPIVYHFNYRYIFNNYYHKFVNLFTKELKIQLINIRTFGLSTYAWLENSIKNFMQPSIPIENIVPIFKNKPVLIISAGPSLNKNIHLIEELKKYAIVVAVGSAIKILDSNKIVPHFRMAIDGLPREQKILEGVRTEDTPIIFGNKLYKEILTSYNQLKIRFIEETDYLGIYTYKKSGLKHLNIKTGPSIANFALSFLVEAECSHIIFMGQDLSYISGESHAKGTNDSEENKIKSKNNFIQTQDIYGNTVFTTNDMLTMKFSFEKIINDHKNIEFINATEGGLQIEGTVNRTANETLALLQLDLVITEKTISFNNEIINDVDYETKINNAISSLSEELIELYLLNENKIKYLKKINKMLNRKININRLSTDIEYIKKLDIKINKLPIYREFVYRSLYTIYEVFDFKNNLDGETQEEKLRAFYTNASKKALELKKFVALTLKDLNEK